MRCVPLPCHAPCRATDARIVSVRGAFMHVCMHATLCSALHIREPRAHAYAYAYTFMHGRTSARNTGASCLVLSLLEDASRQRRRRHLAFLNPSSHMHQIHIHFYAKTPTLARSPARVRARTLSVSHPGTQLRPVQERLRVRTAAAACLTARVRPARRAAARIARSTSDGAP